MTIEVINETEVEDKNSCGCDNCTCDSNEHEEEGVYFDLNVMLVENTVHQIASSMVSEFEETTQLILKAQKELFDSVLDGNNSKLEQLYTCLSFSQDRTSNIVDDLERLYSILNQKEKE